MNTIYRCITNQRIHVCYIYLLCVCMCLCSSQGTHVEVGEQLASLFSPPIVWGPRIELTSSGLVISTFTGLVILPVYEYNNFITKNRTTKTQAALRSSVFLLLLLARLQSVLLPLRYHSPFYCREMGPASPASPYRDRLQKH